MKALLVIALVLLAACREEEAAIPDPVTLTSDALSHFCMMQVSEHGGPNAQVHLEGHPAPIFFAQVRDGLAYLKGRERTARIVALYVSDMGVAKNWETPGADNWIAADTAFFVVGADVVGGMGAPEIAPFAARATADEFARNHGGTVLSLEDVPDEAVFSAIELSWPQGGDL